MKRLLNATISLFALSSAHAMAQTPLDGMYLGGSLGQDSGRWATNNILGQNLKTEQDSRGLTANVMAGYGLAMGRLYVGGEGGYEYSDSNTRVSIPGVYHMNMGFDHSFNLVGRVGYLVQPNFMAYTLGGVEVSRSVVSVSGSPSSESWQNGVRMGLGGEYALSPKTFVRAEYDYSYYGSFHLPNSTVQTISPDKSGVRVGVGFHF